MVGWMASLTRWRWVWESSRSWWWIRKPSVLQSMGSQRVRHDWVTTETSWWLIHVIVWQKPTQHCKAIMFSLKKFFFKCNCKLYDFSDKAPSYFYFFSRPFDFFHTGSQSNYCPSYRLQEEEVPNNSCLNSYSMKEIQYALPLIFKSALADMQMTPALWQKVKRNWGASVQFLLC